MSAAAARKEQRGRGLPRSATPPAILNPGGGKMISARVRLLDDSISTFHIPYKAVGQRLFDQVCQMLSLLEVDYFGLEYSDSKGTKMWLDPEREMCKQLGLTLDCPQLDFCVKFYPPDPARLEEDYTRYLFSLQIKRDLARGILQCNDNTAALMASYIVQAECGDYSSEDYPDHTYLASFKFVPHQEAELEKKIMENHKKHLGQTPSEADINLLETARRCEFYGIHLIPAKDCEGSALSLAVAHHGILVFQASAKINTFSWAKIRKLSFRRRRFLVKLHPETFGYFKNTVEFLFEGRNECKTFWKKCLEYHGFFRCVDVRQSPTRRRRHRLLSKGSSFRYSGRTQKQMIDYVRENFIKRQHFQRSNSLRGGELSCHQPLVPIGESQSCGSISLEAMSPVRQLSASQPSSPLRRDLPPAFESPPPYQAPSLRSSSRGISSGDDESCSPTSPLRSLRGNPAAGDTSSLETRSKMDTSFYVARELVSTERTYKKDLELVNVWLRDEVSKEDLLPSDLLSRLFLAFDPLYEFHCALLRDLELRLGQWEASTGLADLFLQRHELAEIGIQVYGQYMDRMPAVVRQLSPDLDRVVIEFEKLRVCHLPLSAFLLRPSHRLMHYCSLLEALVQQYEPGHPDIKCARTVLIKLRQTAAHYMDTIANMENMAKLSDLQRGILGVDALCSPSREFLREGSLYKLSRRGFQQRMIFLFSDVLIYGSRQTGSGKFRAHGQVTLAGARIEKSLEPRGNMRWCFAIHGSRVIILAATSEAHRQLWLADIYRAQDCPVLEPPLVTPCSSQHSSPLGSVEELQPVVETGRPNTTSYVCWHRGTTVGRDDYAKARTAYISGYLLRKFQNTSGWQKLWVVLANFSLFFYKHHQDDFPLASLPLLGYQLSPEERSLVFRLSFKSHAYYFRVDNDYSFYRWLELLQIATNS